MRCNKRCIAQIILCVSMINAQIRKTIPIVSIDVAVKFLLQCGYLHFENEAQYESTDKISTEIMSAAISKFQSAANLNITGYLNEETSDLMSDFKCPKEIKYDFSPRHRSKRYVHKGPKWNKSNLTYIITNYSKSKNLKKSVVDNELARAFEAWSKVTNLTFTRIKSGKADISISFESRDHGDKYNFDGRDGLLAHSFYPMDGRVHFDDDEIWTDGTGEGRSLFRTAVHEFGHILGLDHSGNTSAIMFPKVYKKTTFELDADDIQGIQALYSPPLSKASNTKNCPNIKMDTILKIDDNHTYVFQGDYYWELTAEGIIANNSKFISNNWKELPGNIDAALQHKDGETLFFKGSHFWIYKGPKMIAKWSIKNTFFTEDNIDAAMTTSNGLIYIFKGDKYWEINRYKRYKKGTENTKKISVWNGLPNNIDVAFTYNGYTNFFKDDLHFLYLEDTFSLVNAKPKYPRSVSRTFFHCESRN